MLDITQQLFPDFNPRSREGSDCTVCDDRRHSGHFNPRSREGSDLADCIRLRRLAVISIHAPAKGATHTLDLLVKPREISIHAPAKGATDFMAYAGAFKSFQSTLPRRERHDMDEGSVYIPRISIHAPAKGATKWN